ncbi:MAG: HD domain-containing protein [Promethearchaeota archaeon]|nr:MAG: HD domain-containing protein [Candidatus Lokiarchaeota archaeon]
MWKNKILDLVKDFKHPAWGFSHFSRIYELSLELAKTLQFEINKDALFAAAYLHDIGAFNPYRQKDKDHSDVAIENCNEILGSTDFPSEKIPLVKDIIKSHMFYAKPKDNIESKIFHDADTLDFMGSIGIARILSIVGKEDWTPDLQSAIKLIERFSKELPQSIVTENAKEIGKIRKKEMEQFLKNLANQTKQYDLI